MKNLAELFARRRQTSPGQRFGIAGGADSYAGVYDRAIGVAGLFESLDFKPGDCVAVIGSNSTSYLVTFIALQLVGAETALINPAYPTQLLGEMMRDLEPDAVVWVGPDCAPDIFPTKRHVDAAGAAEGVLRLDGARHHATTSPGDLRGLRRKPTDIAGYMHTSGTTGSPKFCAQSHEYFLRLGRFIADSLCLSEADVVYAPLPLFHINPLGYGVIGGLVAGSAVIFAERFSASRFWDEVRQDGVTALILHAPPVEILKRATSCEAARGHQVRIVLYADPDFLAEFQIPLAVSGYGSTEVGGLSHTWLWRRGESAGTGGGMSRYGGRSRHDIHWRVSEAGEIEIRADRPGVLFEGYRRRGELIKPFDPEGWFATGDVGSVDEAGNLIFLERRAESIRVKGEYVPINFVEDHFSKLPGIEDLAIWRRSSALVDDEVALFVVAETVDQQAVRDASQGLPAFMRPSVLIRVAEIPRDAGVGKIRRRALADATPIEQVQLV